jgi:CubicO group peptidase (beta-lactamase class C family)
MIETIAPERVGMSSDRLKDIPTAMQAFIDQGKLAGIATLIARRDKVVHFGCYGKLDIAANKPVQPDSLFRIYSLTKPITSVAALILYEEGRFNLDDPVSKWIPEFNNFRVMRESASADRELEAQTRAITFWHLLTHTSGLGYGFGTEPMEPIEEMYRDANILSPIVTLQVSLPEIIPRVIELPLAAQPGTTWHYSLAHDVLGYLIELISGKPFDAFLRERIFEPLGMHDTSFYVPQGKRERFGPMYGVSDENGLPVSDDVTNSPFIRQDAAPSGGAGLVSSMPDYFRFMLMLANGGELDGVRLLKRSTITAMTTNQLTGPAFPVRFNNEPSPGMGFGLGVGVQVTDEPRVGWIGVSGTTAWIYPRKEMIVIAMPQALFNWEASDTFLTMACEAIAS